MPEDIDPRWEYWTADPEIAEAMGAAEVSGFDGLPWVDDGRTGRAVAVGFRFGRGGASLSFTEFRLGRPKAERPDRRPSKRCRQCSRLFCPLKPEQVYCSWSCYHEERVARLAPCGWCGDRVPQSGQRYCSLRCSGRACSVTRHGSPRHLDWDRIVTLYQSGLTLTAVAAAVGTNRAAVRTAVARRGVYRPGKSGPPRVLADIPCGWCGVVFRPPQARSRYCSRACMHAADRLPERACSECGQPYRPHGHDAKFCSNACARRNIDRRRMIDPAVVVPMSEAGMTAKEIATQIGRSEVGVRTVLRRHRLAQQRQEASGD